MCYQRVKYRLGQAKSFLGWFMPNKWQRWTLGILLLATMIMAGRTERLRRQEMLKATARQVDTMEQRFKKELADAATVHYMLQQRIDSLESQVNELAKEK